MYKPETLVLQYVYFLRLSVQTDILIKPLGNDFHFKL